MNDRTRTILALFLIFGVFVISQLLTPKIQPAKIYPKPDTTKVAETTAPKQAPNALPVANNTPEKLSRSEPVREFVISGDGFTAKLSTLGAALIEYKLQNYLGPDGKPVQLIPQGERALTLEVPLAGRMINLANINFSVNEAQDSSIIFKTTIDGIEVYKIFKKLPYGPGLLMGVIVGKPSDSATEYNYLVTWGSGLNTTEKDVKLDRKEFAAIVQVGTEPIPSFKLDKLKKSNEDSITNGDIRYVGVRTKYFAALILPKSNVNTISERHSLIAGTDRIIVKLETKNKERTTDFFSIFIGPLKPDLLEKVGLDLRYKPTDINWHLRGIGLIFSPLEVIIKYSAKLILAFLVFGNALIHNYGLVIIIFSALMKILFFPLTYSGTKSMKRMQMLQPKLKKIQEKHKGDQAKISQETMALYKEHGANPLSGCLPLLIQMPIFFALYQVLVNTIELRQAPFMLWLADLSVKDPYYVLPVLMGIAMFIQQKMTTVDPKQKMMVYIMPVFMAVIFMNMPAGLNLYWLTNNILSIGEQYLIHVRTQPIPQD